MSMETLSNPSINWQKRKMFASRVCAKLSGFFSETLKKLTLIFRLRRTWGRILHLLWVQTAPSHFCFRQVWMQQNSPVDQQGQCWCNKFFCCFRSVKLVFLQIGCVFEGNAAKYKIRGVAGTVKTLKDYSDVCTETPPNPWGPGTVFCETCAFSNSTLMTNVHKNAKRKGCRKIDCSEKKHRNANRSWLYISNNVQFLICNFHQVLSRKTRFTKF